jgi:hypothetical protein
MVLVLLLASYHLKVLHGVVAVRSLCWRELKVIHMNMCKTSLHLARDRYLPRRFNKKWEPNSKAPSALHPIIDKIGLPNAKGAEGL